MSVYKICTHITNKCLHDVCQLPKFRRPSQTVVATRYHLEGEFKKVSDSVLTLLVDQVLRLPEAGGGVLGVDDFTLWYNHLLALNHRVYLSIVLRV